MRQVLIGDTVRITWISSGVSAEPINAAVYDGDEILVDSGSMTDSGNGHYFYDHTVVNTPGYYVAETTATVGTNPYKRRVKFQAVLEQVD